MSVAQRNSPQSGSQASIAYFAVHDESYPRNRRIREYIRDRSGVEPHVLLRRDNRTTLRDHVRLLLLALLTPAKFSAVILSEFATPYSVHAWILAKRCRCPLIVDFFVGKYETSVEDWNLYEPSSIKARILKFQDLAAIYFSDVCFTDTLPRARRFARILRSRRDFLALPVGAPKWAQATLATGDQNDSYDVLYYGNYIPLHGLDLVVEAMKRVDPSRGMRYLFIGKGTLREEIEVQLEKLEHPTTVEFRDSVPEESLASFITSSRLVLGVFGESSKAQEVIPNKVWQALSLGAHVVTRDCEALNELAQIVGNRLTQVPGGTVDELAQVINNSRNYQIDLRTDVAERLERYVENEFDRAFDHPILARALS